MTAIETRLIERLKRLPPTRVAEVVDFVEFLASREERAAAGVQVQHRGGALALPGGDVDEGRALLLPQPAVVVDVAEEVQPRPDLAHPPPQVGASKSAQNNTVDVEARTKS